MLGARLGIVLFAILIILGRTLQMFCCTWSDHIVYVKIEIIALSSTVRESISSGGGLNSVESVSFSLNPCT